MPLLPAIEALTSFIFIVTMITQIIIPLWNDRPIFPMFHKRKKKLEKKLKDLNELSDDEKLAAQVIERANTLTTHNEEILK